MNEKLEQSGEPVDEKSRELTEKIDERNREEEEFINSIPPDVRKKCSQEI